MTRDTLREALAKHLALAPAEVADDANLILLGMTSMGMMELVNGWRREGLPVQFKELVREPTLDGWYAHLAGLRAVR
jgi:aryl carrier-like protein